jgi:hypothetical protein
MHVCIKPTFCKSTVGTMPFALFLHNLHQYYSCINQCIVWYINVTKKLPMLYLLHYSELTAFSNRRTLYMYYYDLTLQKLKHLICNCTSTGKSLKTLGRRWSDMANRITLGMHFLLEFRCKESTSSYSWYIGYNILMYHIQWNIMYSYIYMVPLVFP